MSWVLILQPNGAGGPAVIPGYGSREEAQAAGNAAIDPFHGDEERRREFNESDDDHEPWPRSDWSRFSIIPGPSEKP